MSTEIAVKIECTNMTCKKCSNVVKMDSEGMCRLFDEVLKPINGNEDFSRCQSCYGAERDISKISILNAYKHLLKLAYIFICIIWALSLPFLFVFFMSYIGKDVSGITEGWMLVGIIDLLSTGSLYAAFQEIK